MTDIDKHWQAFAASGCPRAFLDYRHATSTGVAQYAPLHAGAPQATMNAPCFAPHENI